MPTLPLRPTVLLVDDEPDILESLRQLIEASVPGVRVVATGDPTAAVELLRQGGVDLVVSDYRMPHMDGIELLRHAQELVPAAPRVLITAFPKLELAVQAINELRVDRFLIKPIDPVDVVNLVRSLVASPAAGAAARAGPVR